MITQTNDITTYREVSVIPWVSVCPEGVARDPPNTYVPERTCDVSNMISVCRERLPRVRPTKYLRARVYLRCV